MQYTSNLNLKKPDSTDYVNIADLNENMDVLDEAVSDLQNGTSEIPDLQTTDKKLAGAINEVNTKVTEHLDDDAKTIKVKQNITISTSNWVDDTANSGFFIYNINDADISTNTIVDVNIHLSSLETASSLKSVTESFAGYVRLYADEQPTADITADLKLIRELGVV